MRRKSALRGSRGARSAAATTTTMRTPTSPPAAARVLRRAKRASSTTTALITDSPRTRVACGSSAALRLALPSAVPDARVEPRVAEVDEHVDDDEDRRVEQDEILNDDDVALDHRGDEGAPEARHPERLLDRHRAPEHEAQQHAGDGDDG